jgi:hypothetical protein
MAQNTNNAVEATLLEALENYLDAVKRAGDSSVDLQAHFRRIEMLAKSLPPETDPQLKHYLHSKSYRKAWMWLSGRGEENEAGQCRRP